MDFNFDTSPSNENQNNNPPEQSESNLNNLDQILNMDFQPLTGQNEENQNQNNMNSNQELNMDFMMNNMNNVNQPKIDDEEQKRIADRQKEAEIRKQKINEKIQKEEELRAEIRKKASEYLVEFEQKRQENS